MRNDRLRIGRLCGVPILNGPVKAWANRQRFGNASLSTLKMSCTQLLERMGSSAMTSEPAATMMAITARVVGSMCDTSCVQSSGVPQDVLHTIGCAFQAISREHQVMPIAAVCRS